MIRWISPLLGTAAWDDDPARTGAQLVDVRDLVDRDGNTPDLIRPKLAAGLEHVRKGHKVIVACDYGFSRSVAVAAGILAQHLGVGFDQALRRVLDATGEPGVRLEVLSAVRRCVDPAAPAQPAKTMTRNVLVTGGSGFLGSLVVPALGQRHEVVAPSHTELDLEREAPRLDLLMRERQVDTVVHLAHPRVLTTAESLGSSLVSLKNVVSACVENGAYLIFVSSWEVFSGYRTREILASESLPVFPGGTYGQTKTLCEALIDYDRRLRGLDCLILRSPPVYGPHGDRPKFIASFVQKARRGEEITTHSYRNGPAALDLLYETDFGTALTAAVERRPVGPLHLGWGTTTPTAEVARLINELLGSSSPIGQHAVDADVANVAMDSRLAAACLGWSPTVDLRAGLGHVIEARRGLP